MKKLLFLSLFTVGSFAYTNCIMCHNGGMAVKLDTMTPKMLEMKMHKFQKGIGSPMMVGIAKAMNEKEIKEVAIKYGKN